MAAPVFPFCQGPVHPGHPVSGAARRYALTALATLLGRPKFIAPVILPFPVSGQQRLRKF
jgi:hypothetical protein